VIDDDTLFFGCKVAEAGRPSFKGLEAERERVLPRRETTAVIDHHLAASKHVSGLEILHSEVTIRRCANVLGTIIVICVLLGLAIRDVKVLNRLHCTSDS
jgi:RIO-like serine/threonine protein kinase